MPRGLFITLEGGEGAGKSTQAKRLADYIRTKGHDVILTREVGGAPSAEDIRLMWLNKPDKFWDPITELFLISAARREHLVKTVWPALERGAWVISDRFIDSTRAYQGVGMGIGIETVDQFYQLAGGDFEPDLTLLLDLPVDSGMQRVDRRAGQDDRYQQQQTAFHQTLRDAYLNLAKTYNHRFMIIDASQDMDCVHEAMALAVQQKLGTYYNGR